MRDYPFIIREALTQGLRPEQEIIGGKNFLKECYNMKPSEGGLEAYDPPVDPFDGGVNTRWPHPQFFFTSEHNFLIQEDALYTVGTGSTPWTTTQVDTYNADTPALQLSFDSDGQPWHFINLGEAFYFISPDFTVFAHGLHTIDSDSQKVLVSSEVRFQTGTTHKGRAIVGGPNPDDMWPGVWDQIFSNWQSEARSDITFNYDEIDRSWVMWSSVGGGDIPLWLLHPDNIDFSSADISEETLIKRLERNEMGWMPMPFEDRVLRTAVLGENLIVYGRNAIAVMTLTSASNIAGLEDPVPSTYGVRQIADFGIAGRGAVARGDNAHFMITADGEAAILNRELEVQRLGYQEYLGNLPSSTLSSGYNPIDEEFYVCSETEGWLFSEQGLSEHRDHITGAVDYGGTWYGLSHSPTTSDMEVVTNVEDMNLQAAKRVQNVQASARAIDGLTASLQFRYERDDSFQEVGAVPFNKEGVAWLRAAGLEFRLKLEGNPNALARLNEISVRYQVSDKRAMRGPIPDAS